MDVSIENHYISPSVSSHNPLKRTKRPETSKSAKPPKRRKKTASASSSKNRILSTDDANDDLYSSHLSEQTKNTVLKLKKISDPFDDELQQVVDDVFEHFEEQSVEDVDLAESALLLSSVTNVYCCQVKTLNEEVLALVARLHGQQPPPKRGRKKTSANDESTNEAGGESETKKPAEGEAQVGENGEPLEASKDAQTKSDDTDNNPDTSEAQLAGSDDGPPESTDPNQPETSEIAQESTNKEGGESTVEVKPDENGNTEPQQQSNAEGENTLETQILNDIPGMCTRRQSERLKNILTFEKEIDNEKDYKLKKKKFDGDPPDLISCHDEWNAIQLLIQEKGDVDFDEILPPVLEIQVGRRRKKVAINNNDDMDDNNCETCQNASSESPMESENSEKSSSELSALSLLSSEFSGQKYQTLDHLPNDVQERFHGLVQEMHKLPFDYGLMQNDMFKAYQQKFLQAVTLLSQNSVLVKRTEEEAVVIPKATLERKDSHMSESDQAISTIAELLSQVRQQTAEEYHKGNHSKSDLDIPVSQMIATLKRIICSRYKKWHVRTDGDKAVFKRIKEFEDKVKAVLKKEADQGLFDVKKYEMEVMDVTLKESLENEADELSCPLSPIIPGDGAESPRPEEMRNWNLSCSSRRSSIAGSIDGSSSWIRLFDIFSHMKKFDHSETCRHFYAVLALLSHKNLSINYDTLFSKESAKLITKLLKSHNDNSNKYPVGAKIMTSRCPDIDRDEILLAPVLNAETIQQMLEQDGYLSSSGYQSDSQASGSTGGGVPHTPMKTIEDAINEFIPDTEEGFVDDFDLFPRRRRKN